MIELYLGASAGGWALDGDVQGWSRHDDVLDALRRWSREIEDRRSRRWRVARVRLWLSGGLARPFLCAPVAGLKSWAEAVSVAQAMAPEATGLIGPCSVQLEDWRADRPVFATAIESSLAKAVDDVQSTHRIRWTSVRPRWAAVLGDVLDRAPGVKAFAMEEEDALTVLLGGANEDEGASVGGFVMATSYAPAPGPKQRTALWQRVLLSRDVLPDAAWFCRAEEIRGITAETSSGRLEAEGNRRPAHDVDRGWPGIVDGLGGQAS